MLLGNQPQRLDRKIFGTLFLAIFFCVTGVGIVVPLLPVYAKNLGASGLYVGLIFGAFSLSQSVFLPYFGRLSDRKGRKPIIVIGLFSYVLISFGFMCFESVNALIFFRIIQGIASAMIMPVTQAYVGDITPLGKEGFSMGMFNMSMFLGLSIGPLLGGVISESISLHWAFGFMGAMALFGALLTIILLPSRKSEMVVARKRSPVEWKHLLLNRDIPPLFIFRFAYTACIGILWGFLPVYADTAFSLPSSKIGVLLMLSVFAGGIIHIPMGALADRVSKNTLVIVGGILVMYAIFSFHEADGYKDLFIASVVFGLGGGISNPALMALVLITGNRTQAMGSIMAVMTIAHSLGMAGGSLLGGLIMDVSYLRNVFTLGTIIMGAGVILFGSAVIYQKIKRK